MSTSRELREFPSVPPAAEAQAWRAPASPVPTPTTPQPISFDWRKNVFLFVLTVISVFFVGRTWTATEGVQGWRSWLGAWQFAVPLLSILLAHEFGHYIAARLHRVPASLPYFIPLPVLNPFGTLGAVILMPNRIRSRRALLDIGAAGPLAGMVVAIPVMLYGLSMSHVGPRGSEDFVQEGQSLLYAALKYAIFGAIPGSQDVYLHPAALAAWVGFFVTFLNLLPYGQLDGGHVAYALLGERQNRFARVMLWVPLALMAYNAAVYVAPVVTRGLTNGFGQVRAEAWLPVSSVTLWMTLWLLLWLLKRLSGAVHPPVDDHELGRGRKIVAVVTLALFALLFMPSPWVVF
jgi:membrane-associated protease RseP (regulator of RpoE activity)